MSNFLHIFNEIIIDTSTHQNAPDRVVNFRLWSSGKQASDLIASNRKFDFRFILITPRHSIKNDFFHNGELNAPFLLMIRVSW